MLPIILALLTSVSTAISRIFLKKGFEKSNPLTGMFVSLVICGFFLTLLALFTVRMEDYILKGILFFALIGVFAPPLVRFLTYIGIDKLGTSRSSPIRSLTPFFATIIAIIFLRESINFYIITGTILVVCGIIVLSKKDNSLGKKDWKRRDLIFPLAAAFLAGIAANLRKYGFTILTSPVLAAASTAVAALFVFSSYIILSGKKTQLTFNRHSLKFFALSSLCTSVSIILNLYALKYGKVVVVSPLLATSPLFVLIFSYIFLRKIEKINLKVVLAAISIFIGVELIIIFR